MDGAAANRTRVAFFAVFSEIETGCLNFFIHAQTDRDLDEVSDESGGNDRKENRDADGF